MCAEGVLIGILEKNVGQFVRLPSECQSDLQTVHAAWAWQAKQQRLHMLGLCSSHAVTMPTSGRERPAVVRRGAAASVRREALISCIINDMRLTVRQRPRATPCFGRAA